MEVKKKRKHREGEYALGTMTEPFEGVRGKGKSRKRTRPSEEGVSRGASLWKDKEVFRPN